MIKVISLGVGNYCEFLSEHGIDVSKPVRSEGYTGYREVFNRRSATYVLPFDTLNVYGINDRGEKEKGRSQVHELVHKYQVDREVGEPGEKFLERMEELYQTLDRYREIDDQGFFANLFPLYGLTAEGHAVTAVVMNEFEGLEEIYSDIVTEIEGSDRSENFRNSAEQKIRNEVKVFYSENKDVVDKFLEPVRKRFKTTEQLPILDGEPLAHLMGMIFTEQIFDEKAVKGLKQDLATSYFRGEEIAEKFETMHSEIVSNNSLNSSKLKEIVRNRYM